MRTTGFLLLFALLLGSFPGGTAPAWALDPVSVRSESAAIDLQRFVQRSRSDGDLIQISTAPGADGIVRRIAIKAKEEGSRPDWIVFALKNDSNEQLTRWLVAPHFRLVDSGVVWPDLGATRITAVTASQGESPDREENAEADIFEIILDPGATVTYIAELANPRLPQLYLWNPDDYKDKLNGLTLYRGIVIGIAGLLALFLTIVFVVKGAVIFPAAAALAWAVLAYVCIDFGFWQKIVPTTAGGRARLSRRRGGGARCDAAGVPFRLSQPEPLARALQPRDRRVAGVPGGLDRARRGRPGCSSRRGAHLHRSRCGDRVHPGDLPLHARL